MINPASQSMASFKGETVQPLAFGMQVAPQFVQPPPTTRYHTFERFIEARQPKPAETPAPKMSGKKKGMFSKLMVLYKFTGGVFLGGLLPALVFNKPIKQALGIGLLFTTTQYLLTEKIAKGDGAFSRAAVNLSKKIGGYKDDQSTSIERLKAPIWGATAGILELIALTVQKLAPGKKEEKAAAVAIKEFSDRLKSQRGRFAPTLRKAGDFVMQAFRFVDKNILKSKLVTQIKATSPGQYIMRNKASALFVYGVIGAAVSAYFQSYMAARMDETLEKKAAFR